MPVKPGGLWDALTFGPARRRRWMQRQLEQLESAEDWDVPSSPFGSPSKPKRFRRRRRPSRYETSPFEAGPFESGRGAGPGDASVARLLVVLAVIVLLVGGGVVAIRRLSARVGPPQAAPSAGASSNGAAGAASGDVSHGGDIATRGSGTQQNPSLGGGTVEQSGPDSQEADPRFPPPGIDESPSRLLAAVAPPAGSGGYTFTAHQPDGAPMTYDPCRPIHYVIRAQGAPSGGDALVRQAVAAVSAATGLRFVDDGTTTEAPREDRAPYQPDRYGRRWAPVLIAWSTPRETTALQGDTTGIGGSVSVQRGIAGAPGVYGYVTGSVVLDGPQLTTAAANGERALIRAVAEHELGHLVGLGHVADRRELMYPQTSLSVLSYQPGDRRGLAQLGNGPCRPGL